MPVRQITLEYLRSHPCHIFVYGDNLLHRGCRGAAQFRSEPNTYGFVTKKFPSSKVEAFYRPAEYRPVFEQELSRLMVEIVGHGQRTYMISPVGSGLANRFKIWERVIEPGPERLRPIENVVFLY